VDPYETSIAPLLLTRSLLMPPKRLPVLVRGLQFLFSSFLPQSQVGPGNRELPRRRWQERMLDRLVLGVLIVFAVVGVLAQGGSSPHPLESGLVLAFGALLIAVLCTSPKKNFRQRAGTLVTIGLATAATLQFFSFGNASWSFALTFIVLCALVLSQQKAIASAVLFVVTSCVLAVLQTSNPGPAPLGIAHRLVEPLTFATLTAICLWWSNYAVLRISKSVNQRDALLKLVREETQEHISQLEKQQSLERKLRQSQKMEAVGTLAGGVAHDFNNLLLVIVSGAQSAQDSEPEELKEILKEIEGAAKRGGELTQQLLQFGRRKIYERQAVEINAEVGRSLHMIRRLIPSNVELEYKPSSDVCTIEATAVDVDQIIMNLCINARDAMPQGGKLLVTSSLYKVPGHRSEEVMIEVNDDGAGMSEEQIERAFEPFFTTKQTGAGTGLGLSVVHSIVKNYKGRMEIRSEKGFGTTFRVFFPHIDQAMTRAQARASQPFIEAHERILLVDDDAAVRKGVARILKRTGYDVLVAGDGEEALRVYQNSPLPIALVITDAIMPNMGGRDLCEAVTKICPDQPCLVCSGYDAGTLDAGFFIQEGREFLAKPFENEELLKRVRLLLDLQHLKVNTRKSARPPELPKGHTS